MVSAFQIPLNITHDFFFVLQNKTQADTIKTSNTEIRLESRKCRRMRSLSQHNFENLNR